MNNTITEMDLTGTFPPALTRDPKMMALTKAVAAQLLKTNREIPRNIIYAKIDELQEDVLDVLAYDLHVDWYDYEYPIEAKRGVIKDSVRVHKRLGTVFAVRTALGSVYPESEIEEWFDYGGEHHRFRVVLDVTHSRAPADYVAIKKAVLFYKRLSAQMENMIYQCRVDVQIVTDSDKYQHLAGYAGRRIAGTYPQRNRIGALTGAEIALLPESGGFSFISTAAGTQPQRAVSAALRESIIQASGEGVQFSFRATEAGKDRAGEKPNRNTGGAVQRAQIAARVAVDAYTYESPEAGTQPHRSATAAILSAGVTTYTTATAHGFISPQAGAHPGRSTTAEGKRGGIIPEVTGEVFVYRVKRCGTDRCKDK